MTDPTNLPPTGGDLGPITPPTGSAYQAPSMPDITDLVEGSKGRTDAKPSGGGGGGGGLPRGVIIGGVVGALVIAGGAFFAGKATASGPATLADAITAAQNGSLPCGTASGTGGGAFLVQRLCQSGTGTGGAGGQGGGGQGAGGFGGRGVVGAVTAVSASSITVNTRAGSVTVAVPGTTTVNKTVQGSMSDVKVGDNVTVASTTDANGNRTASTITIVPAGSGGGFGPGPQPTGGNA